jgi:hypothetical protein
MKKMLLVMAMAALVCWLPGQAVAKAPPPPRSDYRSYFTYQATGNLPAPTTNNGYGTVTVSLTGGQATITVEGAPDGPFDFVGGNGSAVPAVALNVTGLFTYLASDISPGWTFDTPLGGADFDSLGHYSLLLDNSNDNNTASVMLILYGPWSEASQVLASNSLGFDAGAYLNQGVGVVGYVGEVPLPPSVWLMGTGMLGLAGLGWRRKRVS